MEPGSKAGTSGHDEPFMAGKPLKNSHEWETDKI